MSSIEKLKIVGIRSFSPNAENVIEFQAPLTIIVGHNGAGKTTIIECLKYATTGEMPPNSKGGAFVHDPKVTVYKVHVVLICAKISRENDIKAQIKLKFRNTRQQVMVVTRSLQLTQSRAKLTLKTLESLLATVDPNTGEQVSISSRCAQLDNEMPFHLGVSKAVLQNVIFCHQEESMWPLSESSVLKKRFDEIFAAERYTKALDTLRSLRKQLVQEQKVEDEKLNGLKDRRDQALRLEADIRTAEERITSAQEKITELDQKINESNDRIARLQSEIESIIALQGEFERFQHELQMTRQSHQDLSMTFSIMTESDDELLRILAQHQERSKDAEAHNKRLSNRKSEICLSILNTEMEQFGLSTKKGQFLAEASMIEKKGADLEASLEELCRKLSLSNKVEDRILAIENVQKRIGSMQEHLYRLQQEHRDEDTRSIELIQSLIGKMNTLKEAKGTKRRQIDESRGKLSSLIDQISSIKYSLDRLNDLQQQVSDDAASLKKAQSDFDAADYQSRLDDLVEGRKALEEQIRSTTAELTNLSKFADIRAKLEMKRSDSQRRDVALSKLWEELQNDVLHVLNTLPSMEDVDREVDRAFRAKEREVKAIQERLEKAKSILSSAQSKYEHYRSLRVKKNQELSEKKGRIESVCENEDFSFALEESENELSRIISNLNISQSSKSTYEAFSKALNEKHNCPLCERRFSDGNEENALVHKLQTFLSSLPSNILDQEQRKREVERRLSDLKSLRGTFDDVERIRLLELPELNEELKRAEEEMNKAFLQVEDLVSEHSNLSLSEKRLVQLKRKTEELGRLHRESSNCTAEFVRLESENAICNQENISPEDLESKSRSIQSDLNQCQGEIEGVSRQMRARQLELNQKETRFRDSKERLLKVQLQASESIHLEQQKTDLESLVTTLEAEVNIISGKLDPLSQQIEQLKQKREEIRITTDGMEQELRQRIDTFTCDFSRINALWSEIQSFQQSDHQVHLNQVESKLTDIEGQLSSLKTDLSNVEQEIGLTGKEESELLIRERTIKDNLSLRNLTRRIQEIESRLSTMKISSGNRQTANQRLSTQQTCHSNFLGERSGLLGELRQLEDQMFRHRQDLQSNYPDHEQSFRTQFIKVTACSAAIDDLERYAKALDQAIMKYHGHKMDELNRIIKELWHSTYQGADIDTIEIRADHASEGAGNRTYNYRVVMVKGDSELDMRGRSSAGQRVLASLIIRLALAETFGQSCGILALDEPTTNLDRDNIEALATALADIIRTRRQQANFQIIIITHDEEFVEMLGRHECADYYYRVFKDDAQYSCIEQQAFHGNI